MTAQLPLATLVQVFANSPQFLGTMVMYVLIAAIFYFILIRPQQRQRKQQEELVRSLKRGDEVVTAGGIIGEVVSIKETIKDGTTTPTMDDRITIKSAESRLVVERGRITRIIPRAGSTPTTP